MKEITVAKWSNYSLRRVTRDNGTGYWCLDDGWQCDYPIMYDDGNFGFDNPEYFPSEVIDFTQYLIRTHGAAILDKITNNWSE